MKPRRDWKEFLKELEADYTEDRDSDLKSDVFGGNVFYDNSDVKRLFTRIEKCGGIIECTDYESINLYLPAEQKNREKIYLELLLQGGITHITYKEKHDRLEISWS